MDVIKGLYAAEPDHRIQVGKCACTDLITGNVVLEKIVTGVITDIETAHNIDQYIQIKHKIYRRILAYAVD